MTTIQDRWFVERKQPAGTVLRERTEFHGGTTAGRWRVHYRTPAGKQRNRTFPRKVQAEQFLITVGSAKLDGSLVDPQRARVTVGEVAARWRAKKLGLKPSTKAR